MQYVSYRILSLVPDITIMTPTTDGATCGSTSEWRINRNLENFIDGSGDTCSLLPYEKSRLRFEFKTSKKIFTVTIKGHVKCSSQYMELIYDPLFVCTGICDKLCLAQEQQNDSCVYTCNTDGQMVKAIDMVFEKSSEVCEIIFQ